MTNKLADEAREHVENRPRMYDPGDVWERLTDSEKLIERLAAEIDRLTARKEATQRLLDKIHAHLSWGGYDDRPAFLLPDGTPVTQGELREVFL